MKEPSHTGTTVIFDFDGTLADSHVLLIAIYNEMAESKGWTPLTTVDYDRLRHGNIRAAMQWARIRPWQIPGALKEGRRRFAKRAGEVHMYDGLADVVRTLHEAGCELYVLSTNSAATVQTVLETHGVGELVKVLPTPPLFGKASVIKKLVRTHGYDPERTWMIGDETRDVAAGQGAGVKSIGVIWGIQTSEALTQQGPTALAKVPADILKNILG